MLRSNNSQSYQQLWKQQLYVKNIKRKETILISTRFFLRSLVLPSSDTTSRFLFILFFLQAFDPKTLTRFTYCLAHVSRMRKFFWSGLGSVYFFFFFFLSISSIYTQTYVHRVFISFCLSWEQPRLKIWLFSPVVFRGVFFFPFEAMPIHALCTQYCVYTHKSEWRDVEKGIFFFRCICLDKSRVYRVAKSNIAFLPNFGLFLFFAVSSAMCCG